MTAGSGIVHEEYHSTSFAKSGGTMEMVQLWVNLPADDKMTPPRYQPILASDIPSVNLDDDSGEVRIIAGVYQGVKGPASTFSPMNIFDVTLKANKTFKYQVDKGYNCMFFSRDGTYTVLNGSKPTPIDEHQIILMSNNTPSSTSSDGNSSDSEGEYISIQASLNKDIKLFILSGQPLNEPIAARGPFVMNTEQQLRQAMSDFQAGKFVK